MSLAGGLLSSSTGSDEMLLRRLDGGILTGEMFNSKEEAARGQFTAVRGRITVAQDREGTVGAVRTRDLRWWNRGRLKQVHKIYKY